MSGLIGADEQNVRNMKDFLELYNKLTEMCFQRCITNFNNRGLSTDENSCVGGCVDRYVKFNQRLMLTFMEFQNAKQEATVKELEKAAAEGRTPNIPGIAQEMASQAGTTLPVSGSPPTQDVQS
ncbi:mitochondrial import inner membrane translocase subunit Tim9-like [Ruditapes philippinarum]|uniref:mitochondrial import inner membrane translocase subunit Tim9-like n=1 Tax=Ruditapes philippinarum TaxID=129788 RepID=UPI00295B145D|nr:mitochondrial import inner membrane translocase subunit Tim9-like [Ruditapes philippinarum]XP_060602672.1 mitochondrial import inner membrane translocase subunit Tim9-like [Ruditapes philippinarum]